MVYGTVKQSGGFIFVDSKPLEGAVFRLYFPLAVPQHVSPASGPGAAAPVHGVTILVVEDEPGVRSLVVAALSKEGFRILQAESGRMALALAAEAGLIDVLLTDVTMPEMSGLELAATLARTQEGLRVVIMSGQNENAITLPHLRRPAEFLRKPFTPKELRQKIHTVLDAPAIG
jgi:two-component system cell cycle sensor histidine kinase/response regulator CckA